MVGTGHPEADAVKALAARWLKVKVVAQLKATVALAVHGPGVSDQTNPLGSVPLAVKVSSVFQ